MILMYIFFDQMNSHVYDYCTSGQTHNQSAKAKKRTQNQGGKFLFLVFVLYLLVSCPSGVKKINHPTFFCAFLQGLKTFHECL